MQEVLRKAEGVTERGALAEKGSVVDGLGLLTKKERDRYYRNKHRYEADCRSLEQWAREGYSSSYGDHDDRIEDPDGEE